MTWQAERSLNGDTMIPYLYIDPRRLSLIVYFRGMIFIGSQPRWTQVFPFTTVLKAEPPAQPVTSQVSIKQAGNQGV